MKLAPKAACFVALVSIRGSPFGTCAGWEIGESIFGVEITQSVICLRMAHDVFISHAHKDKNIANEICAKLESSEVRCWIAGRDISAGEDWTTAIRNAIGSSRVMVLVLSENANAATHMEREIAHAFYTNRTILPVRLTQTPLRRDFLFYLSNVRWFDAFNSSGDAPLEALIASVNRLVHGRTTTRDAIPLRSPSPNRKTLDLPDSWFSAFQASHYRSLGILKNVSVAVILLSGVWLLWFVASQWKNEFPGEDHLRAANPAPGALPESTRLAAEDATPSKSAVTFSRFGLWVSPSKAAATPGQVESGSARSTAEREGASRTPRPDFEISAREGTEGSTGGKITGSKTAPEQPDLDRQPVPVVEAASPTEKSEPTPPELGKLAAVNQTQDATPLPTPSTSSSPEITPPEESASAATSAPTTEPTPAMEPVPPVESAPAVEPTPVAESTQTPESAPTVEPTPPTQPTQAPGSAPAVEPTPVTEPTQVAESAPTVESTAKSTPSAELAPTVGSTPLPKSNPFVVSAPLAASTPSAQSSPSAKTTLTVESLPSEAGARESVKLSPEERSLKELVLDYMRTVASDDDSSQERFFAWRVNFYGKGLLSLTGVRESMERYRQKWPVRKWTPQGEPEFPNILHSNHPELYEVLQPLEWMVANGSQHKEGKATLYARIRRDDRGQLHIIHLEQRHPGDQADDE